jgi:hypothetical protein
MLGGRTAGGLLAGFGMTLLDGTLGTTGLAEVGGVLSDFSATALDAFAGVGTGGGTLRRATGVVALDGTGAGDVTRPTDGTVTELAAGAATALGALAGVAPVDVTAAGTGATATGTAGEGVGTAGEGIGAGTAAVAGSAGEGTGTGASSSAGRGFGSSAAVAGPGPGGVGGSTGGNTPVVGISPSFQTRPPASKLRSVFRPQKGQAQATSNRERAASMLWAGARSRTRS